MHNHVSLSIQLQCPSFQRDRRARPTRKTEQKLSRKNKALKRSVGVRCCSARPNDQESHAGSFCRSALLAAQSLARISPRRACIGARSAGPSGGLYPPPLGAPDLGHDDRWSRLPRALWSRARRAIPIYSQLGVRASAKTSSSRPDDG